MGFELDRTASNSIELEHPKNGGKNRQKPMIYEEWSKSIELDRTLTPNFLAAEFQRKSREEF